MFSANENIVLRKEKRRVVGYVEDMLTDEALDMGTSVMVMQVSCRDPGCVPLETVIIVVFPKMEDKEILPGLEESKNGGSYKTKILCPLAQVTKEDVCQSLPPSFKGGKRTMETMGYQLRDSLLAQIGQLINNEDDKKTRTLLAQYLQSSLNEYIQNDCIPPPLQKPYPTTQTSEIETESNTSNANENTKEESSTANNSTTTTTTTPKNTLVVKGDMNGSGNFVIRRSTKTITSKDEKNNQKDNPTNIQSYGNRKS